MVQFFFKHLFAFISAVLALIFLIVLEITDALDGAMARKLNLVSDLGKVLDPFADTVFHITMFTIFLYEGSMPIWMYIISLYRDMFSMFIRILGGLRGFAVAAKFSGKLKTASRAAAVILILSLVYNYNVFSSKISPVSNIIEHAISNATQNFEVYTFDNQLQEDGME